LVQVAIALHVRTGAPQCSYTYSVELHLDGDQRSIGQADPESLEIDVPAVLARSLDLDMRDDSRHRRRDEFYLEEVCDHGDRGAIGGRVEVVKGGGVIAHAEERIDSGSRMVRVNPD
jgi:hypothetical protein